MPLCALLCVSACLRVPGAQSPTDTVVAAPATAAEVLDRYIAALGGRDALEAVEFRRTEARITVPPTPIPCAQLEAAGMPAEPLEEGGDTCETPQQVGELTLELGPGPALFRRTVLGGVVEEVGYFEGQAWRRVGRDVLVEPAARSARTAEDALLHWYFEPDARNVEVTLAGTRNVGDSPPRVEDGLAWTPRDGGPQKTLWFDRQSGLLKQEVIREALGSQSSTQTVDYYDYAMADGIGYPQALTVTTVIADHTQRLDLWTRRVDHSSPKAARWQLPTPAAPPPSEDPFAARVRSARSEAEANPSVGTQLELARAQWAAADFAGAAETAQLALDTERDEPEALWILARAQIMLGRRRAALQSLKRADGKLRDELIARWRAFLASHRGDFRALANALETAGDSVGAARHRTFVGVPWQLHGSSCNAELPWQDDPTGAILLQLSSKDTAFVTMLDTGASDLIISRSLASKLGVVASTHDQRGETRVGHGQLAELRLGELTLRNTPVDILPDQAIAAIHGGAAAVIGGRALQGMQVTLDGPRRTLALTPFSRKCRAALEKRRTGVAIPVLRYATHFLYVPGGIGNERGLWMLNSAMRGADLAAHRAVFDRAGVVAPPHLADTPPRATIDNFAVGPLKLTDLDAVFDMFDPGGTPDGFRLDGMLGLAAVRDRVVTIDLEEGSLYVGDQVSK